LLLNQCLNLFLFHAFCSLLQIIFLNKYLLSFTINPRSLSFVFLSWFISLSCNWGPSIGFIYLLIIEILVFETSIRFSKNPHSCTCRASLTSPPLMPLTCILERSIGFSISNRISCFESISYILIRTGHFIFDLITIFIIIGNLLVLDVIMISIVVITFQHAFTQLIACKFFTVSVI